MQRAITVTAVIVLVLVGVAIKVTVAPGKTVAGTHETTGMIENVMSIYDLHVSYPGMKTMPVQQPPMP